MVRENKTNITVGKGELYAAHLAFFLPGFAIATWAPMIPMVKERLNIEADVLGILLLCVGISAFFIMPIAGMLGRKFGCRKVMAVSAAVMVIDLVVLSLLQNIWGYAVFLAVMGIFMGAMDVNMNVNAVVVEKLVKRRIMSGMHAFWSIGGFVGAGLFSLLAKMGLGITAIASVHCAIVLLLTLISTPHFLTYKDNGGGSIIAVPRGIVIVLGLVAGISFLAEGAVMDWSGVFLTEVKSWDMSMAGFGYAVFSVAMLLMRLIGDRVVKLLGERAVLLFGSCLLSVGFLLIVFIDGTYLMALPFILIGLGGANIVPVLYSMLNRQHNMPIGSAVTAITCMGYTGVILGPAVLGFIAHGIGLTGVFYLLTVLMAMQAVITIYVSKRMDA